jgi:hypothetical protein
MAGVVSPGAGDHEIAGTGGSGGATGAERMIDESGVSRTDRRPLPGTGRLGMVSAYFKVTAVAGALVTAGIAAAALIPRLGLATTPRNPWIALLAGATLTASSFLTGRLLDDRRRAGAFAAGLTFVALLVPFATHAHAGTWGVALAGVGLVLVASVWRHLD